MAKTPPDRSPAMKLGIFTAIRQLHAKYPDLRVGQIIASAIAGGTELFYVEDEKLLELLVAHRDWYSDHHPAGTGQKGTDSTPQK